MPILKKLFFAPFFFLFTFLLYFELSEIILNPNFLFSLDLGVFWQLLVLSGLFLMVSLFFSYFAILNNDWRLSLGTIGVSIFIPLLVFRPKGAAIIGFLNAIWFGFSYWSIQQDLKTSFDFQASKLISPAVRNLATLLVLTASILYFLGVRDQLAASNGFQVPDSLIDSAIKLSGQSTPTTETPDSTSSLSQLVPADQLDQLKQLGIDPKSLEQVSSSQLAAGTDTIKKQIKDQIQKTIAPYQPFISYLLAVLFFFTLTSFVALLKLLIRPLTALTFYLLKETGFISFTIEMKPAKKLNV